MIQVRIALPLILGLVLVAGGNCKKDSLEHYADVMDELIDIHKDATAELRDADDGNEAAGILRDYRKGLQKYLPEMREFIARKHDLKEKNRLKVPEVVLEKTAALLEAHSEFKRTLLFRSPRFLLTLDYKKAYGQVRELAADSILADLK